ncbi:MULTISPECIES: DUF349 domain-containing protein [unclassified Myroides]|uniref:DUF349 domain-containing protein n=1 Tax=unclassified Myroides TaxID=2642485 RepID=UPI003D2F73BB
MLEQKNENLHELADGQNPESNTPTSAHLAEREKALDSITASNAEEGEDNDVHEQNDIAILDYEKLDMEQLTSELQKLIQSYKITNIKDLVEDIKKEFYRQYNDFIEEKKEAFLEENPDAQSSDFDYNLPVKSTFDSLYHDFKTKKNSYYKELQHNLTANLNKRLAIIDRIKDLVDTSENKADALKLLGDLRDEWKNAGAIPKDKYNHVWNNYHFHIERFYDQLHLDRESRDLDFKYNLDQKQKIILRAEELLQEDDVIKAFRELQTLHRIWREEIGPVDREIREEIWEKFSDLTKQLHDKRELLFANLREGEKENLGLKVHVISQIDLLSRQEISSHTQWQKEIKKVEELRNHFFSIGKVPQENNEEVWNLFKLATRNFNANKNRFYKDLKKVQQKNYNDKLALIEKALAYKDSEDYDKVTPIMKQIQEDWKKIGHVPRKYSDQLWKDFKDACNHYFDRLHAVRNSENQEGNENYNKKKEFLEELKSFTLVGDHKTDLEAIKEKINTWKSIGHVPHNKRFIEGKFNKILDVLFDKLSLTKRDAEAMKFSNRLDDLLESNDKRRLQQEAIFIQRKIEEITSGILQLENNLAYVSNATKDNPLVKEVNKNIEKHRDELKIWQDKLQQIKNLDA